MKRFGQLVSDSNIKLNRKKNFISIFACYFRDWQIPSDVDIFHRFCDHGCFAREYQHQLCFVMCPVWPWFFNAPKRCFDSDLISRHRFDVVFLGILSGYVGPAESLMRFSIGRILFLIFVSICTKLLRTCAVPLFSRFDVGKLFTFFVSILRAIQKCFTFYYRLAGAQAGGYSVCIFSIRIIFIYVYNMVYSFL